MGYSRPGEVAGMQRKRGGWMKTGWWCALWVSCILTARAGADGIANVYSNPKAPFNTLTTLFPNWQQAPAASFTIVQYADDGAWGNLDIPIVGVTMLNYGTATGSAPGGGGDIQGMYFEIKCGSKTSIGPLAMTYAGDWTIGAQTYPAWTWAGTAAWGGNPCDGPGFGCSCYVDLFVYVDIGPCPTDGATVQLGPGYNNSQLYNADGTLACTWGTDCPFGVTDSWGYGAPWALTMDPGVKPILYANKIADKDAAAPGDTITYKIYYGMPGTVPISTVTVIDTQPDFTNYITGSASITPDSGWEPDISVGVKRLRWTLAGADPIATAGATQEVSFEVTVDWGNCLPSPGLCFEFESGPVAAPEGERMKNRAHVTFEGASCSQTTSTTPPTTTVVRRFLYWMLATTTCCSPRLWASCRTR